jgi:hypothetical protein
MKPKPTPLPPKPTWVDRLEYRPAVDDLLDDSVHARSPDRQRPIDGPQDDRVDYSPGLSLVNDADRTLAMVKNPRKLTA